MPVIGAVEPVSVIVAVSWTDAPTVIEVTAVLVESWMTVARVGTIFEDTVRVAQFVLAAMLLFASPP